MKGETATHEPPGRAGDTGHHVELDSKSGDTVRAPTVTPQLQRFAAQAARNSAWVFTTLAHRSAEDLLREVYRRTRKASTPDMDGGTAAAYAAPLDENQRALPEPLRSGRYQAAPVERI